jgi:hypothetical protein
LNIVEIFASQGAPLVSTPPLANLPPVSTTLATNFATSSAGAVDTFGKFATGVNNTGGKFASGKLPPVSTTMAANLRSVRCQNLKDPNGIIRGLGETDPCRKPEVEISLHCPFNKS